MRDFEKLELVKEYLQRFYGYTHSASPVSREMDQSKIFLELLSQFMDAQIVYEESLEWGHVKILLDDKVVTEFEIVLSPF